MKTIIVTSTAALGMQIGLSNAAPSPSSHHRACINLNLALPVKANNTIFDVPRVDNNIDSVDLVWDLQRWTAPDPADRVLGFHTVDETFQISAQLCIPQGSATGANASNVLQIATHGFGFDKKYWDSALHPEKYSYVNAALNAGYSILTYDRLGVGKSDKPDAYKVVQGAVEVEILRAIALLARKGKFGRFITGRNTVHVPTFDKIVLVGHSLGSALTIGTMASYGDIADGAVATGAILQGRFGRTGMSAFGLEHAASHDSVIFGDRGSGYLVQGTESAVQQVFFKKGHFNPELLAYADSIKETGTVGEFISLGALLTKPVPEYMGPILFALAEYDFAVCEGDCPGSYDLEAIKTESFPAASDVKVHIQPGSGHALTMHSNATGHYDAIFEYLRGHGL
ncbi:Alpha/Beta hydrolase protein [Aspergillus unguis]